MMSPGLRNCKSHDIPQRSYRHRGYNGIDIYIKNGVHRLLKGNIYRDRPEYDARSIVPSLRIWRAQVWCMSAAERFRVKSQIRRILASQDVNGISSNTLNIVLVRTIRENRPLISKVRWRPKFLLNSVPRLAILFKAALPRFGRCACVRSPGGAHHQDCRSPSVRP